MGTPPVIAYAVVAPGETQQRSNCGDNGVASGGVPLGPRRQGQSGAKRGTITVLPLRSYRPQSALSIELP